MYFVVIIQYATDGTTAQAIYKKDNYDVAEAQFHNELGYRNASRKATVCYP